MCHPHTDQSPICWPPLCVIVQLWLHDGIVGRLRYVFVQQDGPHVEEVYLHEALASPAVLVTKGKVWMKQPREIYRIGWRRWEELPCQRGSAMATRHMATQGLPCGPGCAAPRTSVTLARRQKWQCRWRPRDKW